MSYTVMILDDDPITLFLHKVIIEKSEFSLTPVAFSNARQTIDYITTHFEPGRAFLIFLDINMPGMNGWEFMEQLSKQRIAARIAVVIVSSSIDLADYAKAKTYREVVAYLEKPITIGMINELRSAPAINCLIVREDGQVK
ncbi:MAG TPA: response regulator [Chryseosolibacter sp.]|nr:response regulator [Chryseosolibacter sp.]